MTRILVIEDTTAVREGIVETLELNNYEVGTASDGLEGIQVAREYLPDVIICDIMMPEVSGYDVLQELRNDSKTALIPFIFLTAKSEKVDVRRGMDMGADDYLTKPFKEQHLLGAIKTRLEKRAILETQQLRSLSQKFVRMQEDERRTLARKFQETVAQPLAGLKLSLHGASRLDPQHLETTLTEVQHLADEILARVTHAVNDAWPVILEELGLLPALLQQFETFGHQTGIQVHFSHLGLDLVFVPEVKITVYRMMEELLSNVARHAQVNEVQVSIWVEDQIVRVDVEDRGVGFDLDRTQSIQGISGLVGVRERVAMLGGEFEMMTEPQTGVRVMARLPLTTTVTVEETQLAPQPHIVPSTSAGRAHAQLRNHAAQSLVISIAEENRIIREGLKRVFEGEAGFQVAGEADRREDVLRVVRDIHPNVLVLGITMSGVSNLDLLQPAIRYLPELRVLIFSNQSTDIYLYEAQRSGASGYILSSVDADTLIEAVRVVARGDSYWPVPMKDESLMQRLNPHQSGNPQLEALNSLSSREREILIMIGRGGSSKQIASALSISPRTAETHRTNITRKLGLRTQGDLIRYSIKHGLVTADQ